MTTVTPTIRQMVTDRIAADVVKINNHFGTNHAAPPVKYDVRGRSAGHISPSDGYRNIHLNAVLLNENIDEMVNQTTPHELAHWAEYKIHGDWQRTAGGKQSIHGRRWKNMMSILGVDPDRCHNMDTSNAAVRTKNKFEYKCSGCGHLLIVGPVVHKKIQRGDHRWHKGCGSSTRITYVGDLGQVTYQQAKAARSNNRPTLPTWTLPPVDDDLPVLPTKAAIPVAPGKSKKAKAQIIYATLIAQGEDRATIIARFMSSLDMTKQGANTYYYNCSKA